METLNTAYLKEDRLEGIYASAVADSLTTALGKGLLIAIGTLSLAIGIVGIFVPLLPTTCFLLLSAACYGRSSPRCHAWLLHNKWFGSYLRDYREGRGVPRKIKVTSLAFLWISIGYAIFFAVTILWVQLLLGAIVAGVTLHLAALPTTPARLRIAVDH